MKLLSIPKVIILLLTAIGWCQGVHLKAQNPQFVNIIPLPAQAQQGEGSFTLSDKTTILTTGAQMASLEKYLQEQLLSFTNIGVALAQEPVSSKSVISLNIDSVVGKHESYRLEITSHEVKITGADAAGLFYGIQSFIQLVYPAEMTKGKIKIEALTINDAPQFSWRGMHLDVSRHFYSVDFIKRMLDVMALHKLNTFHWHLTDDQGWRIEIKRYPALTRVSSIRKETLVGPYTEDNPQFDGTPYGGYYTQDDIREVVKHAGERYITVVPEIEMPGHAVAALTAYPQLSCTGGPFEVRKTWGISDDVFCAGKEATFTFLQNVLSEVVELFPGSYIHVGGDECPKDRWQKCPDCQHRMREHGLTTEMELQSYFIKRMEAFIAEKGKKLIGWDEILEGGIPERATVMSWRGFEGGIEAAKGGHDVVMTPTSFCYFDYYQAAPENEPLAIGGFLPIEKVYGFKPVPADLDEKYRKHILGAQSNLWTEYITTEKQVEYMLFPRVCAMAEVLWSPEIYRQFPLFQKRLDTHLLRLKKIDINYRPVK